MLYGSVIAQNKIIVQRIDNGNIRTIKKGKYLGIDSLKGIRFSGDTALSDIYKIVELTDNSLTLEPGMGFAKSVTFDYKDISIRYRADNGEVGLGPLPLLAGGCLIASPFAGIEKHKHFNWNAATGVFSAGVFFSIITYLVLLRTKEHSYKILRAKK